jgi:hypothetical protein
MDRHSRIVLIVIGTVTAILVAVAIALAVQPPPEYDPSTPAGTVQAFYQAFLDGDEALASTYLADEVLAGCPGYRVEYHGPENLRVVIDSTEIDGDTARVSVTITETWDEGPFGSSNTYDETIHMDRVGDGWLIAEPPRPVEVWCP